MSPTYTGTPSWATSSQKLFAEIQAAERLRDDRLKVTEQQIRRFHTPAYEGRSVDIDSEEYWPHNHYFEFIALVGPQIAYDNPRAKITSQRSQRQKMEARALQFATNRWIRDSQAYSLNDRILVDYLFGFGVVLTTQKPVPGYDFDDPPHAPQCSRISPKRFLMDPQALEAETARFRGHEILQDKDEMVAEAEKNADGTWNIAAVKAMTTGEQGGRLNKPDADPSATERNQVKYYEIWVPEAQLEEDPLFCGTIYTIGLGDSSTGAEEQAHEIRAPRAMFGPRWGQYTIYGSYYVPDKPFPLSPLTASEGVVQEANVVAQSMSRSAANRKRIALLDGTNADSQKIVNAQDGEAVTVESFDKAKVLEIELGGNTKEQYDYRALVVSNMDRGTGQTDAQRGNVTGVATATENQLAAMAGSARNAFLARRFRDAEAQKLRTVAWYLSEDDRTVMSLGDEAAKEFGQEQPIYLGGRKGSDRAAQATRARKAFPGMQVTARDLVEIDGQSEEHETFDSLDLEISPYSMPRTDPQQIQAQSNEIVTLFATLAPLMVQAPFVDWTEIVNDWGEQRGIEDLGRFVNKALALQFAALNFQAMQQSGQPAEKAQPRKSSDVPQSSGAKPAGALPGRDRQPRGGPSKTAGVQSSPYAKKMART